MAVDPSPTQYREQMLDDEPAFEEVLASVFGIQEHEIRTYRALLSAPSSTVEELAADLDRDRSNVNRSLSTLRHSATMVSPGRTSS